MTRARVFTSPSTLARRLHDYRGLDIIAAVQAGEDAIKALEPRIFGEVDRALDQLDRICRVYRRSGDKAAFPLQRVYSAASAVAGLSAAIDRRSLGKAAASLCRLIATVGEQRPAAIAVHIEAIALIRREEHLAPRLLTELERLSPPDCPEADPLPSAAHSRPVLKGFSAL